MCTRRVCETPLPAVHKLIFTKNRPMGGFFVIRKIPNCHCEGRQPRGNPDNIERDFAALILSLDCFVGFAVALRRANPSRNDTVVIIFSISNKRFNSCVIRGF
jgi:hypothetical protein